MDEVRRHKIRRTEYEATDRRQSTTTNQSNPQATQKKKLDWLFLSVDERAHIVACYHYQLKYGVWPARPSFVPVKFHEVDFHHLKDWEVALVTDQPTGVVVTQLNQYIKQCVLEQEHRGFAIADPRKGLHMRQL